MKKAILIFLFPALLAGSLSAQNLIAVQNGSTPVFYANLDTAINNAQNGDTIYLPGYLFTPSSGEITIDKELHIIGTGHHPDSTFASGFTKINGSLYLVNGASHGSVEGVYFTGGIYFGRIEPSFVSGFSIIRNNIGYVQCVSDNSSAHYVNNTIRGNVINGNICGSNGFDSDWQSNFIFNNIITAGVYGIGPNNVVKNNVIGVLRNLDVVTGCLFENNVFLKVENYSLCRTQNSIFRNNLSGYDLANHFVNCSQNVFVNNNIENSEFTFVNPPPSTSPGFNYDLDFHLLSGSIGKNAGRDGTDVGIYGGNYPWKEGSLPFNPHYQKILVAPQTDNQGNLNVNIRVKAQEH